MVDYEGIIRNYIASGTYVLESLEGRIDQLWVEGKLTDEQRAELLNLAAEGARDVFQTDVLARLSKVEHDVWELLHPVDSYRVWYKGLEVLQHEIVRYDVTGDGELDLCQYNGGRASTVSWIGGIEGWNLLDRELNIVAVITRDADKNFIIEYITPDEDEEPESTPEDEPTEPITEPDATEAE